MSEQNLSTKMAPLKCLKASSVVGSQATEYFDGVIEGRYEFEHKG